MQIRACFHVNDRPFSAASLLSDTEEGTLIDAEQTVFAVGEDGTRYAPDQIGGLVIGVHGEPDNAIKALVDRARAAGYTVQVMDHDAEFWPESNVY